MKTAFFALTVQLTAALSPLLAVAEPRPWQIGEDMRITLPETFQKGKPFPVKIEILKAPGEPQKLDQRFNYIRTNGFFGGSLQPLGKRIDVSDATVIEQELTVEKEKPDLGVVLFTVYLSPDGSWQKRTMQATVPIMPEGGDRILFEKQAAQFVQQTGVKPQKFEPYEPRTEYFTQRQDTGIPGARDWKPDPQTLPPLAEILARPASDRSNMGVYSWGEEFAKAGEEIKKIGFRSARISGPWADAGPALKFAAENDIEILFTLMAGDTLEAFKQNRRPHFETDEALIEAFASNIKAFLAKFGPEGSFFKELGLKSPVKAIELWNEPNFQYLIPDGDDRKAQEPRRQALYAKMIPAGYDAVKEASPGMPVAAFATGASDKGDLRFIKAGLESDPKLTEKFDILSTHPYTMGAPPEGQRYRKWGSYSIANSLAEIRGMLAAAGAPKKPVWYTEMGWEIADEHGGEFAVPATQVTSVVTPDMQAAYVVRNYLWAMRLGVDRVMIMHLHDADRYNCGFLERKSFGWRPVAHATKNLIDLLPNPKLTGAQSDGKDNTYIYEYLADHKNPATGTVIAAWNVNGPKEVKVNVKGNEATLYDLLGNQRKAKIESGAVSVQAGPYPVFIRTP